MNYYAVRSGLEPGIYRTWDECKINVVGVKGATYKKFDTLEEAEAYMSSQVTAPDIPESGTEVELKDIDVAGDLKRRHVHAFVDGSHISVKGQRKNLQPTYGVLILQNNPKRDNSSELMGTLISGSVKEFGDVADVTMSNQIAGELYSALRAIEWATLLNMKEISIYYDYRGIMEWGVGDTWGLDHPLGAAYRKQIEVLLKDIKVNFVKIKGHTDVAYNEIVDVIAKSGKYFD